MKYTFNINKNMQCNVYKLFSVNYVLISPQKYDSNFKLKVYLKESIILVWDLKIKLGLIHHKHL